MDSVTRSVVKMDRRARRNLRKACRKAFLSAARSRFDAYLAERQLASEIMHRKLAALGSVNTFAAKVATAQQERFEREGQVVWVCYWKGPHHGAWCFLHGRHRVTLLPIPGSVEHFGRPLQLGSNCRLYRIGRTKTFEANLLDRPTAESITQLKHNLKKLL